MHILLLIFCIFFVLSFFEELKFFVLLKSFLKVSDKIRQIKNKKIKTVDLKKYKHENKHYELIYLYYFGKIKFNYVKKL